MKSAKRVIFILLILVVLCTTTASAFADNCYKTLSALFTMENGALWLNKTAVPGPGVEIAYTMLWYDTTTNELVLATDDERITFADVDYATGLRVIYSLCGVWDAISTTLDSGYAFAIGLLDEDPDNHLWISDASGAALFRTLYEEAITP